MEDIKASSVCLVWATRGSGWPDDGVSYNEAKEICAHLSEDGTEILGEKVEIWRLPTVEEAWRASMAIIHSGQLRSALIRCHL